MHPDKKTLILQNTHFFVIEKHIEGVRQDEKHVPDLLEAIIQSSGLVKEELRGNLCKMNQFGSQITKNLGFNFLDSGNLTDSRRRPMPAFSLVGFKALQTRIIKKMRVLSASSRFLPQFAL